MAMLETLRPRERYDWGHIVTSRWLWCIAAIVFMGAMDFMQRRGELSTLLGDADDATRLYQVRQLMAGGGWFDMTLPRLGGATPLISHWSRLIDVPLVMLLDTFGLFMSPEAAELSVRFVWPLLVLLLLLRVVVRAADHEGGVVATAFVLFMGLTCMTGLFQFRIGRIDHHNGMIMGSIGGLLLLVHARVRPQEGYLAGMLMGIGLSVGYEPLAFLLPAVGLMALLAVTDLAWLRGVRNMAVALAATLAVVFVATVAPSLWFSARCDALSLNMVVLVAGGAGGLAVVDWRGRRWTLARRIAALAGFGAVGLLAYGALDVRCLAGPFGQVDPAVNAVWLDHVVETMSIFKFFPMSPPGVVAFAASIAVGIYASYERWLRLRTAETLVLLGLMLIVAPTGVWMVKLMPYASWVAVFCTALSIADLQGTAQLTALSRRLVAALLGNQLLFASVAAAALTAVGVTHAKVGDEVAIEGTQCLTTPAVRSLAVLPKGLFVGGLELGSFIVALTQHDALAAPYHRIDKAILINQALLAAEPAQAKRMIDQVHADYLVLCMPKDQSASSGGGGGGLEARLKAGTTIAFLTPMPLSGPVAELRVWRVER